MKPFNHVIVAVILTIIATTAKAQVKVKTEHMNTVNANELEIVNQLSTQSAIVNMPVSKLLNAPATKH